jgi:hypothetical protein
MKRRDQEFRLPKISYVDYKQIEMDRVLMMLFPRLKFEGNNTRRAARKQDLQLDDFIAAFQKHDRLIVEAAKTIINNPQWHHSFREHNQLDAYWLPALSSAQRQLVKELLEDVERNPQHLDIWFEGLVGDAEATAIMKSWVETDLMDVVNRGRPNQVIAAPRPLHGNVYKFRNARHARDYNASEHLYWLLFFARRGRGQDVRNELYKFFFQAIDRHTDSYDVQTQVDIETQALLRLDQQVSRDERENKVTERYPPLCVGHADLLADDVLRLLTYQKYIPRTVLVDYLRILFAFHLALYQLRLLKFLPALVKARGEDASCGQHGCPLTSSNFAEHGACRYRPALVVDMGSVNNSHMTELAQRSAAAHYRRIPAYIHAHFVVKKLDEMADSLARKLNRIPVPAQGFFSVKELLQFLQSNYSTERENYFQARLVSLIEDFTPTENEELDPEIKRITGLELGSFETFIEILVTVRGRFHRQYLTECLDSLLLKNSEACLLRQARARNSARYFNIGSRLLEVLLQIAVLEQRGSSFVTRELSIDDLLTFLRERYGIYIDRLPTDDGFDAVSILDRQALRQNVEAFKNRLREIGFFEDLSDAYITQTVTSRYQLDEAAPSRGGTEQWG